MCTRSLAHVWLCKTICVFQFSKVSQTKRNPKKDWRKWVYPFKGSSHDMFFWIRVFLQSWCVYIYIYIHIFFIYEKFQGSNVDSMLQLMLCVPFVLLDKSFRLKACWSKILTIYIYMYAACHFWIFWILFLSIFFPLGPTIDWGTGPAWLVDWQQWKFWCFKVRNNSRLTWPVSSKEPTAFSDPLWTYLRTGPSPRGKQNIICGQRPICWGTLFGTFCQKTRVTSWYMQMRTWSPEPNG